MTATPPPSIIGFKPIIIFKRVPFSGGHGGGGGNKGRIIRRIAKGTAPNDPNNSPDTCHFDSMSRYLHAGKDFALWKLAFAAMQIYGRGEVVTIEYNGGGTEDYMWIPGRQFSPTAPPATYLLRLEGTLDCNS